MKAGYSLRNTMSKLHMSSADSELVKWICPSCGFIFDEQLGFKKKYPPGTKFSSIPVFNCPVCGASKGQFELKKESGNPIPEGDTGADLPLGKAFL